VKSETRINILAPEQLKRRLTERAALEHISMSEVIRKALERYCRSRATFDEENQLKDLPAHWKERISKDSKTGCWSWTGAKIKGYPHATHNGRSVLIHRFSYSIYVGKIKPGLVVHHECRNKSCVNPKHLRAVTQRENLVADYYEARPFLSKTHCPHGHEMTPENTITVRYARRGSVGRRCGTCSRERARQYQARRRTARAA
jgi:hypothetical protein